jgi:predicted nicotinamide N-methyase
MELEENEFRDAYHQQFNVGDVEFTIATSGQLVGNTGKLIWDATLVLMEVMTKHFPAKMFEDKVIVELGCGTGILGVASTLALKCKEMILTDLPVQLPLISYNVRQNISERYSDRISCLSHYWGSEFVGDFSVEEVSQKLDVLICSDLLFCAIRDSLQEEFLQSMLRLTEKNPESIMLFAFEERVTWKETEFMKLLSEFFVMEEEDLSEIDLHKLLNGEREDDECLNSIFDQPPAIHILVCKRKIQV